MAIRGSATVAAMIVAVVIMSAGMAESVWIKLPNSGTKCVSEEINAHVVVLGEYSVFYENHFNDTPTVSSKITSPYGNSLHHKENVTTDTFAFTTTESGNYLACFWVGQNPINAEISLNIDWRTGIATKDWDSVAKKEKLEGVELELTKLESLVEAIHDNLLYLRSKEAEMREVSEKTNSFVAWFSILALSVCIFTALLQLWYLKTYFRKKKLI
ncbi:transmembrane emp24 domain-containing protein p24delta3-like [Wolffia australiana]